MRDKVQANGYRHLSEEDRFWMKVDIKPGCWEWLASKSDFGHGKFYLTVKDGKSKCVRAHRYIYEKTYGPVGGTLFVRHRCDNPSCVNPEHLEVGTHADNMRDMRERGRSLGSRRYCKNGHAYSKENTATRTDGMRRCLKCQRIRDKRKLKTPDKSLSGGGG